jgi:hypothetical protein
LHEIATGRNTGRIISHRGEYSAGMRISGNSPDFASTAFYEVRVRLLSMSCDSFLLLLCDEALYHSLQWRGWIGELREKGKLAVRVRKQDLPLGGRSDARDWLL